MEPKVIYIVGKTGCLQAGVDFKEGAEITFNAPLTDAKAAKLGLTLKEGTIEEVAQDSSSVAALIIKMKSMTDMDDIQALKENETRSTALTAIDKRLKELGLSAFKVHLSGFRNIDYLNGIKKEHTDKDFLDAIEARIKELEG